MAKDILHLLQEIEKLTIEEREKKIIEIVESKLPNFKQVMKYKKANVVIIHQDAFGADYQFNELLLIGCFVKYAGIKGKELHIIGKNRETLKK